jgi:hypothetical protein
MAQRTPCEKETSCTGVVVNGCVEADPACTVELENGARHVLTGTNFMEFKVEATLDCEVADPGHVVHKNSGETRWHQDLYLEPMMEVPEIPAEDEICVAPTAIRGSATIKTTVKIESEGADPETLDPLHIRVHVRP